MEGELSASNQILLEVLLSKYVKLAHGLFVFLIIACEFSSPIVVARSFLLRLLGVWPLLVRRLVSHEIVVRWPPGRINRRRLWIINIGNRFVKGRKWVSRERIFWCRIPRARLGNPSSIGNDVRIDVRIEGRVWSFRQIRLVKRIVGDIIMSERII